MVDAGWRVLVGVSVVGVEAGRMAASNVLMLKKAGDKRQEQALQEAFKVSMAKLCAYN